MQGEIGYAGADPQRFLLAEVDEVSQAQSRRAGAAGRARYMPGRVPRPCADTVGCRQRARDLSEAHLGVEHVRIARALEIEVARQCLEEGEKLSFGRKQRLVVHRLQRYLRPRQAAEQVVQHAPLQPQQSRADGKGGLVGSPGDGAGRNARRREERFGEIAPPGLGKGYANGVVRTLVGDEALVRLQCRIGRVAARHDRKAFAAACGGLPAAPVRPAAFHEPVVGQGGARGVLGPRNIAGCRNGGEVGDRLGLAPLDIERGFVHGEGGQHDGERGREGAHRSEVGRRAGHERRQAGRQTRLSQGHHMPPMRIDEPRTMVVSGRARPSRRFQIGSREAS